MTNFHTLDCPVIVFIGCDDPHCPFCSKAPSPTSANKTIVPDSCWDEDYQPPVKKTADADPNTSILPDYTEMEEDDTIWESEASNKEKFSFSDGILGNYIKVVGEFFSTNVIHVIV